VLSPALRAALSGVEHRRSEYLNHGLERDHSHLKQRLYPMRDFSEGRQQLLWRGAMR
jgi:transposase-like protein